jgi:hypothetical protein
MTAQMKRYKNLSGDSGVVAYETGSDSIKVEFADDGLYLYTYERIGAANIEQMKVLAASGKGLATFINRHVREKYAAKLR